MPKEQQRRATMKANTNLSPRQNSAKARQTISARQNNVLDIDSLQNGNEAETGNLEARKTLNIRSAGDHWRIYANFSTVRNFHSEWSRIMQFGLTSVQSALSPCANAQTPGMPMTSTFSLLTSTGEAQCVGRILICHTYRVQLRTTFGWVVGGACFLTLLGGGNSNSRQE